MTSHLSPADRAELNRVWSELAAAQRVIERLLGDDDPTGLTYSRDDEEPVAAPTRPHDGFSITGRPARPHNSPAGFASTERRTHQTPGRPGLKQGEAGLRGLASPTLRGGGR